MNRNQTFKVKIVKVSDYRNNQRLLSEFFPSSYKLIRRSCNLYPKSFVWYWENILNGNNHEMCLALVNDNIVGVSILEKCEDKEKICAFTVDEDCCDMCDSIAEKLFLASFEYLGTTTPLIIIPEYKLPEFESFVKQYDWKQTQILDHDYGYGYYHYVLHEIVFNGIIS